MIKSIIQNAIRGKNVKAIDVVLGWISSLDARKAPQESQNSFPEITREALARMTPAERTELYRSTLAEMNRKAFDSDT